MTPLTRRLVLAELAKLSIGHEPSAAEMPDPEVAQAAIEMMLATVFDLFRDIADRVELTEVNIDAEGDVVVATFSNWREVERQDHPASDDRPSYSFVTLER